MDELHVAAILIAAMLGFLFGFLFAAKVLK